MIARRIIFGATFALCFLSQIGNAQTSSGVTMNYTADAFIRQVCEEAIQSLTNKNLSDRERQQRFRSILNRTFNIKLIARFTLGYRNWRRATKHQREEYVRLFKEFIVQAYAARFKNYRGEKFFVGKVREINNRDKLVHSALTLKDGRKIPVHWRVRSGEDYKIIDVLVENVSMAITQRDEFAAIIKQKNGEVEELLAALRHKTARK